MNAPNTARLRRPAPAAPAAAPTGGHVLKSVPAQEQDPWNETVALIGQAQDRQAFASLFRHFAPRLRAYGAATPMIESPTAFGDELAQEVMISVWQKARLFDAGKASATTWIFAIARNRRIDLLRRRQRRRDEVLLPEELFPELPGDDDANPFSLVQERRLRERLETALATLPGEQSEVLVMTYVEGRTHTEVAEALGLPLGTVKSRIRLALQKLRLDIEEGWQP